MNIVYHPSCILPLKKGERLRRLPVFFNCKFYLLYVHPDAYVPCWDRSGDRFKDMIGQVFDISEYDDESGKIHEVTLFIEGQIKNNRVCYTYEEFSKITDIQKPDVVGESDYRLDHLAHWFNWLYSSVQSSICRAQDAIDANRDKLKHLEYLDSIKAGCQNARAKFLANILIKNAWRLKDDQNSTSARDFKRVYDDTIFDLLVRLLISKVRQKNPFILWYIRLDCGEFYQSCSQSAKVCNQCNRQLHIRQFSFDERSKSRRIICQSCDSSIRAARKAEKKEAAYQKKLLIDSKYRLRAKGWPMGFITDDVVKLQATILDTKRKIKQKNNETGNCTNAQKDSQGQRNQSPRRNPGIKRESRRSLIGYAKSYGSQGGE